MLVTLLLLACEPTSKPEDTASTGDDIAVTLEASSDALVPDATPGADGADIAYVTSGDGSALHVVGEDEPLASFTDAVAVVATPDGSSYLVADAGEDAVYSVPVGGGEATVLSGASAMGVSALEIHTDLYFSGMDLRDGSGAVYRLALTGGAAELLVSGLPTVPSGLTVSGGGTVYAAGGGAVYEIADGTATPIAEGLTLGDPAGLALTPDDSALMVSSLSEVGTAQALIINLETLETSVFDSGINANVGAAGLHRAQGGATTYGWAGVTTSGGGVVYRINF